METFPAMIVARAEAGAVDGYVAEEDGAAGRHRRQPGPDLYQV